MPHLHTLKFLPSTSAIQAVSAYNEQLKDDNSDFKALLLSLKKTVFKHHFMTDQDNSHWALVHGADYLANPKLFSQAPLAYVSAIISETCKSTKIEDIAKKLPKPVLQKALARLAFFSR